MRRVKIIIGEDGKARFEWGPMGPLCYEEARRLIAKLKALGIEVETEKVFQTAQSVQTSTIAREVGQ
jgi:hypothetical protein